jgi:hypothetical protein
MKCRYWARAALPIFLLLFTLGELIAGSAQEGRKVLVRLRSDGLDREAWTLSLETALAASPVIGVVLRAGETDDLSALASRLGCDLAVDVRAERVQNGVRVEWSLVDPSVPSLSPSSILRTSSFDAPEPDAKRLSGQFWIDLVPVVEASLKDLPRAGTARLIIAGAPGTIVRGFRTGTLVIPASGSVDILVRSPGTYRWFAAAPGLAPAEGVVFADGAIARLDLDMQPLKRFELETGLMRGAFPDVWLSWYDRTDHVILRAGLEQYLGGLSLNAADASVFASYSLVSPGLGCGLIFGSGCQAIRLYAQETVMLRLALLQDQGVRVDPVAPLLLNSALGLQWNWAPRWSSFFELGVDQYIDCDGALLAAAEENGVFAWPCIVGPSYFIEFPSFRFGVRYRL